MCGYVVPFDSGAGPDHNSRCSYRNVLLEILPLRYIGTGEFSAG